MTDQRSVNSSQLEDIPNFHTIQGTDELPQHPCSVVNIFVENMFEAQRYAAQNPKRTIYWIADRQIGVWYTLLRRRADQPFQPFPLI